MPFQGFANQARNGAGRCCTFLSFHAESGEPGAMGSIVYMDEYVGEFRVHGRAVLRVQQPGQQLLV